MTKEMKATPPCGWNSWDCFGAGVTERQLKENADYMAKYLKPYGWEYIVCDIQWYEPLAKGNDYNHFAPLCMDGYGRLLPAENRFPSAKGGSGFAPIAEYCHALGLKFGIHIMRGVPRQAVHADCPVKSSAAACRAIAHPFSLCSWNTDMYGCKDTPGAQDYYNSIFELYASWGVDFIKCDDIALTEFRRHDQPYSAAHEIEMIRRAIDAAGRDMVLSLSPGPARLQDAPHLRRHADMWRMAGDFWDEWEKLYEMFDLCKRWQGEPAGRWPDCDMLPLGVLKKNAACRGGAGRATNFTKPEQLALMSLWGIFKSPLMFGGNLPENDEWTLRLLTNRDYMEMYKTAGRGREIYRKEGRNGGVIAWQSCGRGCKYFALFNTKNTPQTICLDIGSFVMPGTPYRLFDIWAGAERGTVKNKITAAVDAHGAALFRLREAK